MDPFSIHKLLNKTYLDADDRPCEVANAVAVQLGENIRKSLDGATVRVLQGGVWKPLAEVVAAAPAELAQANQEPQAVLSLLR